MKPGETVAQYRIIERLGAGGMGEVYKALDTKLNRPVALKTLRKEFVSNPDRRRRFVQEAHAASALDHPNIVTIHDIAEVDGLHFIVMQYVDGESLGELIRNQRLDLDKALDYAVQMAEGLERAHRDGIIHRDLKPDNVMVSDEGRAKLVDFGLAKLIEAPELSEEPSRKRTSEASTVTKGKPLTQEGEILGTGAYMSPEQARGQKVDARSDIFSFGSVLYEMVTGQQAFSGENIVSVLASILKDEPKRVSQLVSTVPADLEAVIEKALRKDREKRFQSVTEFRAALVQVKEERARNKQKPAHSQIVRLGDFEVDLEAGELRKHGRKLKLQEKPFQILTILLERPGRVVSREELVKRLWPDDTFVDFERGLNTAIRKLRSALGDSAEKPHYIETVARRGYRFIGTLDKPARSSTAAEPPVIPAIPAMDNPLSVWFRDHLWRTWGQRALLGAVAVAILTLAYLRLDRRETAPEVSSSPQQTASRSPAAEPSPANAAIRRGRHYTGRYLVTPRPEDFDLAMEAFQEALALEPERAEIPAEIAHLYALKMQSGGEIARLIPEVELWALRAIDLDSDTSQAWDSLYDGERYRLRPNHRKLLETTFRASRLAERDSTPSPQAISFYSVLLGLEGYRHGLQLYPLSAFWPRESRHKPVDAWSSRREPRACR